MIERMLSLDGIRAVKIQLFEPTRDGLDYVCEFRVDGLSKSVLRHVHGVDQMQALQLALQVLRNELLNSDESREGRLDWNGRLDLGFSNE